MKENILHLLINGNWRRKCCVIQSWPLTLQVKMLIVFKSVRKSTSDKAAQWSDLGPKTKDFRKINVLDKYQILCCHLDFLWKTVYFILNLGKLVGTWHCVRRWYSSETQSPLTLRSERALKGYTWGTDGQAGDGVEYSSKGFVMGSLGPCWIVNAHSGQFWYQNSTSTGSIGEQRKIFAYEGVTWPTQTYISAKKTS